MYTDSMTVEFICTYLLILVNYPKIEKYLQMEDVKSMSQHKEFGWLAGIQLVAPKTVLI